MNPQNDKSVALRIGPRVFALLVALACLASLRTTFAAGPDDADIKRAIEAGQKHLRQVVTGLQTGRQSLVTMALLKTGVSPQDPQLKPIIEKISQRVVDGKFQPGSDHVYDAGVTLMALSSADPVKYRSQIEAIAKYIIKAQQDKGFWDYPSPTNGDTSITQYAMLGLWEASRCGVRVPAEVWDKAAAWHLKHQNTDGGFAYHPAPGGMGGQSLHSMTAAALGSLHLSRRHLYPDARDIAPTVRATTRNRRGIKYGILEPYDPEGEMVDQGNSSPLAERIDARYTPKVRLAELDEGIEKGFKWLEKNFTVSQPSGWPIYYLYALERAGALGNVKKIGDHDWYEEGAGHLLRSQSNGTWNDPSGMEGATSFGVLFLGKATSKMLGRKPAEQVGAGLLTGGRGLPQNLEDAAVQKGKVEEHKPKGSFEELLAELEKPQPEQVEAAQTAIVQLVQLDHPEELVGQIDRLTKLARNPRPEVRRTALWALGRSREFRTVPVLIEGLDDPDLDVFVEARNALRVLSRKVSEFGVEEEPPTREERETERAKWRKWWLSVRPYDQRDDLTDAGNLPPR